MGANCSLKTPPTNVGKRIDERDYIGVQAQGRVNAYQEVHTLLGHDGSLKRPDCGGDIRQQ